MTLASRREFLGGAGGLALGAALACRTPGAPTVPDSELHDAPVSAPPGPVEAAASAPPDPVPGSELLPSPDLSDARVMRFVAGVRPYRRGGIRLERERLGDRTVVHDYGHGGAGITLSWGCADEVLTLVRESHPPPEPIAVLGAGVAGLTCAHRLSAAGYTVRVLAREFSPDTTSDIAGGQWAPALVDRGRTGEERERFDRLLRRSYAAYEALVGERYGVFRRPNYATRGAGGGLRRIPRDLIPPVESFERLPFEGRDRRGDLFHTFLIEPPRFLPALTRDLEEAGVAFEQREFTDLSQALELPERVLVNALGLGATALTDDANLRPLRGQLVLVEPQKLDYLISHSGYIFPRSDAIVLGGTVERGDTSTEPDPVRCRRILAANRAFFS